MQTARRTPDTPSPLRRGTTGGHSNRLTFSPLNSPADANRVILRIQGKQVRLNYYSETDSLYLELRDVESVDSREVAPGIVLDFDEHGNLVGIDIDHASKIAVLSSIEASALPIARLAVTGD